MFGWLPAQEIGGKLVEGTRELGDGAVLRAAVEGPAKLSDPARPARQLQLPEVECGDTGDGIEGEHEQEGREYDAHAGGGAIFNSHESWRSKL